MHTLPAPATVLVSLLAVSSVSCAAAPAPANAPSSPSSSGDRPDGSGGLATEGAPSLDAGPTTTTAALGDAGPGTKLPEARSTEASGSPVSPPPKGPHTHDPGRSPQDIRAIIVAHRDEARACYEKALKDHPGIEGDLVVQWTIDPKGNVTQTSLDMSRSTITEPTALACVSDIIKKIHFAESAGGFETRAFYPFNFHPRHGTPPNGQ